MDNQDKATFSLNDDEEIVEEEVIDRDEEYDDDDYDDEGDYDDEEYDDEDGDGEEEDYDDGYNDDYYDDRLNKVLDELAELKRGMVPATPASIQPQPPIMPPQYIYQPTAPPAGSEVVMYNEISRLRDELAKNQSSLEMQKELSRMKEDMMRDQKFAESQYNAEIKRLQDRIDDLLKNGSGPQGELPYTEQARIEGGHSTLDIDKLLSINEAILRATRDSDARLQGEIGQLKKQLDELPSMKELGSAVSAVKKAVNTLDGGLNSDTVAKLTEEVTALKALMDEKGITVPSAPAVAVPVAPKAEINASELLRQLYAVKTTLGSASEEAEKRAALLYELVGEYKKVSYDVRSQNTSYKDKLNAVYDIVKKLEGIRGADVVDLVGSVNALARMLAEETYTRPVFNDITAFCNEHGMTNITPAVRDCSDRYFRLCQKLAESKTEVYGEILPDLLKEINTLQSNKKEAANAAVIGEITAMLVDEKADKAEISDKAAKFAELSVAEVFSLPTVEMPDNIADEQAEDAESIFDKLAEIKADIQMISMLVQDGHVAGETQGGEQPQAQDVSLSAAEQAASVDDASVKQMLGAVEQLKSTLEAYSSETGLSDALEEIRKQYIEISDKIVDISEKIQNSASTAQTAQPQTSTYSETVSETADGSAVADDLAYIRGKLDEYDKFLSGINELRTDIMNAIGSADMSQHLTEQTNNIVSEIASQFDKLYDDLSNVLIESEANIINHIEAGSSAESPDALENAKADILADTQAIKDSLIAVSDSVSTLPDAIGNAKVDILADTQAIKDSVFAVSDSVPGLADTLENVRADILADTQAIKDSLVSVSDSILVSPVADAVELLRSDVGAYIDQYTVNADAAATDRQRLIDDVAFLREQAELAIADSEQITDGATAVQDTDKFVEYLDDIASRVTLLTNIADDTTATRAAVTAVGDNVNTVNDNINTVNDNVAAMSDNIATVNDNINAVNDNVNAIAGNVSAISDGLTSVSDGLTSVSDGMASVSDGMAAVSNNISEISESVSSANNAALDAKDAATAALDALTPIAEQLNTILDRLDASAEGDDEQDDTQPLASGIMADEELIELKDSLNTILDTLPLFPQADDVITARDNTYAILDSLALMPQAEDVVTTRDNVAAVLDAIGTLSDNIAAMTSAQDNAGEQAITELREAVDASAEDIAYIRQKLDGSGETDTSELVGNIEQVLDRIEQLGVDAANNKQEIIDAVSGIREEIHINTLDENMSAAGMDGETRDALLGEIAEIRERLGNIESSTQSQSDVNAATLEGINAQLADLQALIADRMSLGEQSSSESAESISVNDENMQALFDQLSAIREKLDVAPEYDTVEEILSLRDDVKASRIVDQDDVSGELESIKNELAAISSGNILDEIRALREDIANLPGDGVTSEPTDSEINLVLNEIVSLRDEVFAFKDEVLNATLDAGTTQDGQADEDHDGAESADDVGLILDEISALRADQSAITENLDELKNMVSRRTSVAESDGETSASDELNVVLDEIINLKNEIDRIEESLGSGRLDELAAQVEEIRSVVAQSVGSDNADVEAHENAIAEFDITPIMEQFDAVNAALDDLRLGRDIAESDGEVTSSIAERFDMLQSDIDEIKNTVAAAMPQDYSSEIAELRAEVEELRAENARLKADSNDAISAQLADLKETIRDMALAMTPPAATADGDTSYAALIEELRDLKSQVAATQANATASLDEQTLEAIRDALAEKTESVGFADELSDIRDEIAQLRSLTTVAADSAGGIEVAAIRDEIAELKAMIASPDSLLGVAEDVTAIKTDIQTLKEEPDLGVMSEILALREEFQSLREQIEDVKRIAGRTDKESDESLMNEVQSLRDQLFAISMANVNDPSSGESNYESYNNIILDELSSLRDQIGEAGSASDLAAITDEFGKLQASLDKREAAFEAIADRVAKLDNDATNNRILDELASLRTDMSNQREADLTTLNFMSEMAHLLERQNQYLTQNAGTKIRDELESIKAEIASSDAVAEEVAKLREVMTQSGSASDNETILNELADLREELSSEKPSRENALILDAIARLRDEITTLAERETVRDIDTDSNLSDSLTDLKEQLNEIAGIMEPTERAAAPQPTKAPGAKRGRKPGQKNGTGKKAASVKNPSTSTSTGAKRGRKPGQKNGTGKKAAKPAEPADADDAHVVPYTPTSDFDALIDEQASKLVGDGNMSLNADLTPTKDAMDVADRLAKQVANKLVMEQLVEQLGDGGVSDDRVEEILRDILPQEFTTIAETEASDKVRRLANQLVLNKLRSRLNGKNVDDDE